MLEKYDNKEEWRLAVEAPLKLAISNATLPAPLWIPANRLKVLNSADRGSADRDSADRDNTSANSAQRESSHRRVSDLREFSNCSDISFGWEVAKRTLSMGSIFATSSSRFSNERCLPLFSHLYEFTF